MVGGQYSCKLSTQYTVLSSGRDLDEDVQVAMAITASIAEQEDEERRAMGLPAIDRQVSDKSPSKKIKKRRGRPRKQGSM